MKMRVIGSEVITHATSQIGIYNKIVADLVFCRAIDATQAGQTLCSIIDANQAEQSGNEKKVNIIWVQTYQLLQTRYRKPGQRTPGIYTLLTTNGIIHQEDAWNVTKHHVSAQEPSLILVSNCT